MADQSAAPCGRVLPLAVSALTPWQCTQCGAALPIADQGSPATRCSACGTVFIVRRTVDTIRAGGITVTGQSITIGGDVIYGNKVVISTAAD